MSKIPITLLFLIGCSFGICQQTEPVENGNPFLKNYAASQYKAHAQNFAVVQDAKGMMYFGNFAGILQFDGEFWRLIPTANTSKVSSLAIDQNGTIFVGARGEIGYLAPDAMGNLSYQPIRIDKSETESLFLEVSFTYATPLGVFFITQKEVMRWKNGKLDHWKSNKDIIAGFYVQNTLYLQVKDQGLMIYKDKKLIPVPKGEIFAGAIEIKAMLPYPGNQILIATGTQGLYLLGNNGVTNFPTKADTYFEKNIINSATILSDETYAFGTTRKGIIIIHPDGSPKQTIDKKANLQNENVQYLYPDQNNVLWAALNNGISMIEIPAPLTYFDDKSGLNGGVNHILRFNQRLYISTFQGLFYWDQIENGFRSVPEIITSCWMVIPVGNDLLAATSQGVFLVKDNKARIIKEGFALSLAHSKTDPLTIFVGEIDGLIILKKQNGQWMYEKTRGLKGEVNDLMVDDSGNLWGSTISNGIFRYLPENNKVEFFDHRAGLPETIGAAINLIGGKISVSSRNGVYLFDETSNFFLEMVPLKQDSTKNDQWFTTITEDRNGNLWVTAGDETEVTLLEKRGNSFIRNQTPFLPISDFVVWYIFPEINGDTWFGSPDGLIKYDPSIKSVNTVSKPVLMRKVSVRNDSVIYFGDEPLKGESPTAALNAIPYSDNTLRFEFAAPFYSAKGENEYQFILDGFEETWSDWNTQTHKEYTNLPQGNFLFRVKARNIYGNISMEATFGFRILSPWYLKWWAILTFVLLAGGLIYLIVILRNRQLMKEKHSLEQKIAERTAEVVQQKEEIEKQSDELANKNDELEKINTVVKSINSEIHFANLLQSLLEKTRMIKAVEKSTALIYDNTIDAFRFKASFGWDIDRLDPVKLTLHQAEKRYLKNAEELHEDIFLKREFTSFEDIPVLSDLGIPKSMLVLVIKVENKVEAFLILENMTREDAFENKDLSFIRNSKEHIISAFIKTRILEDLQSTLNNLKATQDQLIQSEKLASLGQLTAGIAHEIQNPLNFVNNFSSLSADLADELKEFIDEIREKLTKEKYTDIEEVIQMIKSNVQKINEHGKRAESIVKGMLQHSRGRSGEMESIEINNMVAEFVNLAYHGMRAKDKSFNTSLKTDLDPNVGKALIIPQDLSRVILNIVNNSCYAVDEKAKKGIPGFSPEVVTSTKKVGDKIEIRIKDNGTGIPPHIVEKIFNPFFTTKPTGKGTGLGLSMSYDIVTQIHKGKLEVKSQEGEYTEFIITIPEKP